MRLQDRAHLVAEISLHFEDQAADAAPGIGTAIAQNLIREGIEAAGRLAAPDRPDHRDTREQAALGNRQPRRVSHWHWPQRMMLLPDDQKEVLSAGGLGIARQRTR